MIHSDYQQLIQALDRLSTGTCGADTLRAVFEKHTVDGPAGLRGPGMPTTREEPTDQARQHPLFKFRHLLLPTETVDDVAYKMEQFVDGFVEENQARADQGLSITPDGRALFVAMSRFMSATATPIPGAGNLYDWNHVVTVKTEHDGGVFSRDVYVHGVRSQCREWMDRLIAWFPDLNPDQGSVKTTPKSIFDTKQFMADVVKTEAYTTAVKDGTITRPFTWNGTLRALVDFLNDCQALPFSTDRNGNRHPRWSVANNVFTWNGTPVPGRKLSDTNQHMPKD